MPNNEPIETSVGNTPVIRSIQPDPDDKDYPYVLEAIVVEDCWPSSPEGFVFRVERDLSVWPHEIENYIALFQEMQRYATDRQNNKED